MPIYLGIDTSNYTTSTVLFDTDTNECIQSKKLLPVKEGELGLRQSDAVFHHVNQFSELIGALPKCDISAIGVSTRPRTVDGSYMPCFLVGKTIADSIGSVCQKEVYYTSHQIGHILAALYSCNKLDFLRSDKPFLAFHFSGGTTDCILCRPSEDEVLKVSEFSTSSDLKAGQAVDRVGLMLGLKFPCGAELEKLANTSSAKFKIKPSLKNGNCSLSGIENKCKAMLEKGEPKEDIALYCLKYIEASLKAMAEYALSELGDMPIIFAGGVMSNKIIRASLSKCFESYFSEPSYSCDNACGTAIYAAIKDGLK